MADNQAQSGIFWRPNLPEVVQRYQEWYAGQRQFLVTVTPREWNSFKWDLHIDVPTPKPLEEYDFSDESQLHSFLEYRLKHYEVYWQAKRDWDLDDDFVPVFEPRLGWAEVVAPLVRGADVKFYAQTSQMEPVIDDYHTFEWDRIGFDRDSPGALLLRRMNSWSRERARGRFLVQPRGSDSNPSDSAKACRGTPFFTDLVEQPEQVEKLLSLTTRAVIDSIEYQYGLLDGPTLGGYGTMWNGGFWTPGKALGHVGDNVSDLVSGPMFARALLPHLRELAGHFGGCVFARDVSTKQIWPFLRELGNVLVFQPRDMGSRTVTPDDVRDIAAATGNLRLGLQSSSYEDFAGQRAIARDLGLQVHFTFHCQDWDEASRAVEDVRRMG